MRHARHSVIKAGKERIAARPGGAGKAARQMEGVSTAVGDL